MRPGRLFNRSNDCNFFLLDLESIDNVIKTVVREHHWRPSEIESLYLDGTDFFGLLYWYEDISEVNNELKTKKTD